jgi:hydrophobic/amphiphilic exporter-1 (mainly G- bacteria), HAE1 family
MVIIGGLVVSQFITLYITPVIYLYLEDFQERVLDKVPLLRSARTHKEVMEEFDQAEAGDVKVTPDEAGGKH